MLCYLLLVPWYVNGQGYSPSLTWGSVTCYATATHSPSLAKHPDWYPQTDIHLCINPWIQPVFSTLSACTLNFYPVWQRSPLKKNFKLLKNFKFLITNSSDHPWVLDTFVSLSVHICINAHTYAYGWVDVTCMTSYLCCEQNMLSTK